MYKNIGHKIKNLAQVIFVLEALATVIWGLSIASSDNGRAPFGLFIAIAGPLVSFISSWFVYGFGEIIETLQKIRENTMPRTGQKKKKGRTDEDTLEELPQDSSDTDTENQIPQVTCPHCGTRHDFDYPKCPKCNHNYSSLPW